MNLTLDFGNSRLKAGIFSGRKLVHTEVSSTLSVKSLAAIMKNYSVQRVAMSSVIGDNSTAIEKFFSKRIPLTKLNHSTKLPFHNHYKTLRTLGTDRVANIMGARFFFPRKNVLVISAGTCITYDVITKREDYYGGNITPGIDMRLKAMNTFTARLPLVRKQMTNDVYGASTKTSMLTGVLKGTTFEMQGFILQYKKQYPSLKIILTGGDAQMLESLQRIPNRESKIFAVPHLVLYGLNEILLLNDAQ